ncbi:hypothetical protein C7R94_18250 [Brevibacillus sp. NRRL NRS-603]|nr:hypothetical protein C7R94_18250 [Brevibacillus sp. NRRL NRS-603]
MPFRKNIVEKHRGTISVQSELIRTCLEVRLQNEKQGLSRKSVSTIRDLSNPQLVLLEIKNRLKHP